jgi:hypothetical protein
VIARSGIDGAPRSRALRQPIGRITDIRATPNAMGDGPHL